MPGTLGGVLLRVDKKAGAPEEWLHAQCRLNQLQQLWVRDAFHQYRVFGRSRPEVSRVIQVCWDAGRIGRVRMRQRMQKLNGSGCRK
eukprot:SAG31_NODE_3757_length_3912_cov_2.865460_2_plen_87_part_00